MIVFNCPTCGHHHEQGINLNDKPEEKPKKKRGRPALHPMWKAKRDPAKRQEAQRRWRAKHPGVGLVYKRRWQEKIGAERFRELRNEYQRRWREKKRQQVRINPAA